MTKMSVPNQTNEIRLMTRVEERGERKKRDNGLFGRPFQATFRAF